MQYTSINKYKYVQYTIYYSTVWPNFTFLGNCHDGFSGHILQNGHILELRPLNERMNMLIANYHHTEKVVFRSK